MLRCSELTRHTARARAPTAVTRNRLVDRGLSQSLRCWYVLAASLSHRSDFVLALHALESRVSTEHDSRRASAAADTRSSPAHALSSIGVGVASALASALPCLYAKVTTLASAYEACRLFASSTDKKYVCLCFCVNFLRRLPLPVGVEAELAKLGKFMRVRCFLLAFTGENFGCGFLLLLFWPTERA